MKESSESRAKELIEEIIGFVNNFTLWADQSDDITCLVVKYLLHLKDHINKNVA